MEVKRKVYAYITVGEGNNRKLLVFQHKENELAGWQVPGGTIEDNELLIDALYREIEEESGLTRNELELVGKVSKSKYFPYKNEQMMHERNYFHVAYLGSKTTEWVHLVQGTGVDHRLSFCYKWVPLHARPSLAAKQDEALEMIL